MLGLVLLALLGATQDESLRADIHAHPSRFHRAAVARIENEEIARYQRSGIDVVVCNISTDTPYRGGYIRARWDGDSHRQSPAEYRRAVTLDRLARILKTIEDPT